jgi:quaternary ammonium compound-resistance protein SugE
LRPHKFLRAALKRLNKILLRNLRTMQSITMSGMTLLIVRRRLPSQVGDSADEVQAFRGCYAPQLKMKLVLGAFPWLGSSCWLLAFAKSAGRSASNTQKVSRLPTIGTVVAMAASIGFLGLALKALPVGTAYAVWTGIGTGGTTALGIYLFNEPATLLRLCCISFILVGIIGLKIVS